MLWIEVTVPSASASRNRARSGLRISVPGPQPPPIALDQLPALRGQPDELPDEAGEDPLGRLHDDPLGGVPARRGDEGRQWEPGELVVGGEDPGQQARDRHRPHAHVERLHGARVDDVHREEVQVELVDREPSSRGVDERVAHVHLAVGAADHEEPATSQGGHRLLGHGGCERRRQDRVDGVATGRQHLGTGARGRRRSPRPRQPNRGRRTPLRCRRDQEPHPEG